MYGKPTAAGVLVEGKKEPTAFGWYLLHLMAEHEPRLTQSELARRSGIGQGTISRWIYDHKIRPETDKLGQLADALNIPKNELLQRAGHGTAAMDLEITGPDLPDVLREAWTMLDPTSNLTDDEREGLERVLWAVVIPLRTAMRRKRRRAG